MWCLVGKWKHIFRQAILGWKPIILVRGTCSRIVSLVEFVYRQPAGMTRLDHETVML